MDVLIKDNLMWFSIAFGAMLLIALIMHQQSLYFYTKDVVIRKFGILDLELPDSAQELVNVINGIFLLPADQSRKTLKALRGQLYVDFIFMPAAYASTFLLCIIVASKMYHWGHTVFLVLAWLQIVAWLCDIIENIYLLNKLHPGVVISSPAVHKAFQAIELVKWGITLTAAVCSVFGLLYFWLTGHYYFNSLHHLAIIIAEVLLFIIGGKILHEKTKDNLKNA